MMCLAHQKRARSGCFEKGEIIQCLDCEAWMKAPDDEEVDGLKCNGMMPDGQKCRATIWPDGGTAASDELERWTDEEDQALAGAHEEPEPQPEHANAGLDDEAALQAALAASAKQQAAKKAAVPKKAAAAKAVDPVAAMQAKYPDHAAELEALKKKYYGVVPQAQLDALNARFQELAAGKAADKVRPACVPVKIRTALAVHMYA